MNIKTLSLNNHILQNVSEIDHSDIGQGETEDNDSTAVGTGTQDASTESENILDLIKVEEQK